MTGLPQSPPMQGSVKVKLALPGQEFLASDGMTIQCLL